jgi:UDP-N-acetylglucosamine 2-epimerase (non-hydrolysing)
MKVAIVLGTRPEIIKLSPIIRHCQDNKIPFFIVHSGQHYSANMDTIFFKELKLPQPKYNLHIGKLEYRKRVGMAMKELSRIMEKEWPDVVVVQGDTFTVLAGALTAKKYDRPVAHLEAGLRSHDLSMPEENNRIITDHIAEFLYPPTAAAAKNLREEGLDKGRAPVYGNTVADAAKQNAELSKKPVLKKFQLEPKKYVLVTAHRQENVDHQDRLHGIIDGLLKIKQAHPEFTLLFPLHPRTEKMMQTFGIQKPTEIHFVPPTTYLETLQLEKNAALIITDSGGLQEEATIFHVPCVTMRDNTERPETIDHGMNVLAGADASTIASCATQMLKKNIIWKDLYGKGDTATLIMQDLEQKVTKRKSVVERAKWVLRATKRVIRGKS